MFEKSFKMEIFVEKFGGASVNSSSAVRNVEKILKKETKKRLVVISAMGKTTNKLEVIVNDWYNAKIFNESQYLEITKYHKQIIKDLFCENNQADCSNNQADDLNNQAEYCNNQVDRLLSQLKDNIQTIATNDYNFLYDQIVSFGEKISTTIISCYLNYKGIKNKLISSLEIIKTDNNYRDANVNIELTQEATDNIILPLLKEYDLVITQGFIGGTKENLVTTLGREGSDYSAGLLAHCLKAKSMTIWKDVPGLLNADPKRIEKTTKIISVPYSEAIELSYYGATIIHPKTIKPLENLNIPLYIKSFKDPNEQGTVICQSESVNPIVPNYIFKDKQILLSIFPNDFSFATETNISKIFSILAKHKVKVNLMQNSAISFSVCFDENRNILPKLLEDLEEGFSVLYNTNLQLITIRHYTEEAIKQQVFGKRILVQQRSRITAQFLVSNNISMVSAI